MAKNLTRSDVRVLRSAVYPMQWMGLMTCCGMAMKRMGILKVRKMKALTVEMETVTWVKVDRI